jgi:hypothetical protein
MVSDLFIGDVLRHFLGRLASVGIETLTPPLANLQHFAGG